MARTAAGAGDVETRRAEFERFVSANGTKLLHTAYGLCGDWQHAEDLVQQTLVRIATRWSGITGDPLAYAYRCVVRANIDRWRARRRYPEVLADPAAIAALQPGSVDPPVATDEDRSGVLEALQGLPFRQRSILVLRYVQDLSEAQTAEVLGISVGAVKSGASRGLARLRDTIESTAEYRR